MKRVLYLSGPHINVEKGYWLYDQVAKDGYEIVPFYLYRYGHSRDLSTRIHQYTKSLSLVLKSRKDDIVLLYDVTTAFILIGLLVNILHLKRNIVCVNFMGNGSKKGYEKWKSIIIGYAFKNLKIGVNSTELRNLYTKNLKIDTRRFYIVKDCISNVSLQECDCTPSNENYIFMGGNTHRDWKLFKEVVLAMPNYKFVAALAGNDLDDIEDVPNITVYKNISLDDFNGLVAKCKLVFLPLTTDVQGGLLVAFHGNVYRKPVIISNSISTETYYGDNDVLKVPIGDVESCKKAIEKLMKDGEYYNELANNGHERIRDLSPEKIYGVIKEQF